MSYKHVSSLDNLRYTDGVVEESGRCCTGALDKGGDTAWSHKQLLLTVIITSSASATLVVSCEGRAGARRVVRGVPGHGKL